MAAKKPQVSCRSSAFNFTFGLGFELGIVIDIGAFADLGEEHVAVEGADVVDERFAFGGTRELGVEAAGPESAD